MKHKMLSSTVRQIVIGAVASMTLLSGAAYADNWPSRPIKIITPFPPGGATDILARLVAEKLPSALGQPVLVENRPGASTIIGASAVAKASPDGYTFLLSGLSTYSVLPALKSQLPYDPRKEFAPVAILARTPLVLAAGVNAPFKTMPDFLSYSKAKPGQVTYATYGPGSITHLAGEIFANEAGVKLLAVPYKGGAAATLAAISGEVALTIDTYVSVAPHIKSGRLVPLAVVGTSRVAALPDVPTMGELKFQNAALDSWYGLAAPAGTPKNIVDKLHKEVAQILASPEVREKLNGAGMIVSPGTGAEFTARMDSEIKLFTEVGRRANISMD